MANLRTDFTLAGLEGSRFASQRVITVPTPAAGIDFTTTVPGGRAWVVKAINFTLTTDATVANRGPLVRVSSEGRTVVQVAAEAAVAASSTAVITFGDGLGTESLLGTQTAPFIRDCLVLPGDIIASAVVAIVAGDTLTAINLWVAEFYYPH